MEIPNSKYPFFSYLMKFQKCLFKWIHQVLTSPNSLIRAPYNTNLQIEVHCALIEYENEKAKPVYYLAQLTDLQDLKD